MIEMLPSRLHQFSIRQFKTFSIPFSVEHRKLLSNYQKNVFRVLKWQGTSSTSSIFSSVYNHSLHGQTANLIHLWNISPFARLRFTIQAFNKNKTQLMKKTKYLHIHYDYSHFSQQNPFYFTVRDLEVNADYKHPHHEKINSKDSWLLGFIQQASTKASILFLNSGTKSNKCVLLIIKTIVTSCQTIICGSLFGK